MTEKASILNSPISLAGVLFTVFIVNCREIGHTNIGALCDGNKAHERSPQHKGEVTWRKPTKENKGGIHRGKK
jgi:hypothetical protein